MSLLTRPPHTVQVQNRKQVRTGEGARDWVNDGDRITVGCMYEPGRDWSKTGEDESAGLQAVELLHIFSRTWPGDINSHVFINGEKYETNGAPQHFRAGRRSRHWRVTVKWIGADDGG